MSCSYKPLGQALGILETCIVRRSAPDNAFAHCLPRRGRFLVWRPGEDDLSNLVWWSMTEAGKAQKAEAA